MISSTSSAGDVEKQMEKMNGPDGLVDVMNQGKQIYMVSDGTGSTVEHSVHATLEQLDHCHVDAGCPVNTRLFSGVFSSFALSLLLLLYLFYNFGIF